MASPRDTTVTVQIQVLGVGDEAVLADVAPDVFDHPVQPGLVAEFLADPRHHLAVAREAGRIVGFASAVHYVHPDKPPELWVNEVGVAETHQRRGLATGLLRALFAAARAARLPGGLGADRPLEQCGNRSLQRARRCRGAWRDRHVRVPDSTPAPAPSGLVTPQENRTLTLIRLESPDDAVAVRRGQ